MKDHKDDLLVNVDSTTSDEVVTERGEMEDMVVDVVTKVEDVKTLEKVEVVVKEVIQENGVIAVVNGSGCDYRKFAKGPVIGDSNEAKTDGGEIEVMEKTRKETEEGSVGKHKAADGVKNQSLKNEMVNAGTCEDNVNVSGENTGSEAGVDQRKKESLLSTIEATKQESQKSGNGTQVDDSEMVELDIGGTEGIVERPTESVQEAADFDSVMSEETGKDEILDSTKIPDSVTQVDEVVAKEGLAGKDETQDGVQENAEVDKMNKEESSESTIEVRMNDAPISEKETDSKTGDEPEIVKEVDMMDKGETLEQHVNSVQEDADGDHNSLKIHHSSIMASLGLEEDDVVVVDEGLEGKTEAQDPANESILTEVVNVGAGEVDQKAEEVAYSEPASATNKLVETDTRVQTFEVEPATIAREASDFQVDQGSNADLSRVPDSAVEVATMDGQHGVLLANSEFSYEDAHMERVEDAGMDIDEVLGWKDEIPSVQEHEQKVDPTNLSLQQSRYFHPPENEGEFSVSDLVWGKVRSHPWWPGQIFDPSDASEKAMKFHKKDCFLVAYFGDRTFGWNDSTVLKPFRDSFSQIMEHMNSEAFDNAVHCALQEVSRRVELGLTCSCIPHEIYENIKYQIVENSGIKQESSKRHSVDKSASVNSFEPDMLVDYVRFLAKFPSDAGDKMELTMAKAQLSSYGRFKGHRQLAEFHLSGDLLEVEQVIKEEPYSEDDSKKRKAFDSISDGLEKRTALQTETGTAKPSFKVVGCIQKVASQVTGPPEQVTINTVSVQSLRPTQLGNQADMLAQLHMAAQDPMKGIIQNYLEENPLQGNQNGGGRYPFVAYEQEKPVKPARRSNKKRFFSSNHEIEVKEQSELIERRQKNLATEVLMKFTEGIYFPSEIHLNKMFRRFGPLVESETEVDRQSGRARVVFKKCSDAEVAHSSAGKFNIFGSINVNYELNYTPLISYKPLPLPLAQDPAHAC